jgi:hypothetical protein
MASLSRLDFDRTLNAVRNEAMLVGAVMPGLDEVAVDVSVEGDLGPKHNAGELSAIHRTFGFVLVRRHPDSVFSGEAEEPEHMTAGERCDEHFLRIGLFWIAAELRCAGGSDRLCSKLDGMGSQILSVCIPMDASDMSGFSSLIHGVARILPEQAAPRLVEEVGFKAKEPEAALWGAAVRHSRQERCLEGSIFNQPS